MSVGRAGGGGLGLLDGGGGGAGADVWVRRLGAVNAAGLGEAWGGCMVTVDVEGVAEDEAWVAVRRSSRKCCKACKGKSRGV